MVTYLGALVQLCCGEGGTLQTNIAGMCGKCTQCIDHIGLPQLKAACSSQVYNAQSPGCFAQHSSKWALHFMHIPSLSHSGSCSRGPYKSRDSVGHALCALPRSEQLRRAGAWRVPCPRWTVHLSHLLGPSRSGSRVCHVSPLGS